nr:type II/IV secretion system protein [Candidatus Saccharibacteria bacterium]
MRISDRIVEQLITNEGKVTPEQLEAYKEQGRNEKKPLQDIILNANAISERDLTKAYSEIIDIPYTDIDIKNIDKEIMHLVPERIARQYNVVVIGVNDKGQKLLAMDDPDDIQAISSLQKELGNDVRIFMATRTNILQAIDQYRENISSEITEVISAEQEEQNKGENFAQEDLAEDSPVAQTVNLLVEGAIKSGASDIHIEPREG